MHSEKKYREVVGEVCNQSYGSNNDFIIALAIRGLLLLPCLGNQRPFDHYIQAPHPEVEFDPETKKKLAPAWAYDSWIVDCDWEDHMRPKAAFQFTPLRGKK